MTVSVATTSSSFPNLNIFNINTTQPILIALFNSLR